MGPAGEEAEESAHESFPDDLDQRPEFDPDDPEFDPDDPEPIPPDHFDQSWGA